MDRFVLPPRYSTSGADCHMATCYRTRWAYECCAGVAAQIMTAHTIWVVNFYPTMKKKHCTVNQNILILFIDIFDVHCCSDYIELSKGSEWCCAKRCTRLPYDQKMTKLMVVRQLVGKVVCSSYVTHQKFINYTWILAITRAYSPW